MKRTGEAVSEINQCMVTTVVTDRNNIVMSVYSIDDPSHVAKILQASELTCHMNTLVIGAGICGLTAARILKDAGYNVVVVDKGRGIGGRMATRRTGDAVFDHGAQFVTARTEWFNAVLAECQRNDHADIWYGGTEDDTHTRWRGTHGMTSIPKHLSEGLDVRTSTQVTSVSFRDALWHVECSEGHAFTANACILTAPVPQALTLLDAGGVALSIDDRRALENLTYERCFAVMATLAHPLSVHLERPLAPAAPSPIALISDNYAKGISPVPCLTIHSTPEFALHYWENDRAETLTMLVAATHDVLQCDIIDASIHGWKFSRPERQHSAPCLAPADLPGLVVAGDAFGGPRIEGAALSGKAAADHILMR
ncbi:MAG: FAD-binding protein [Candidatus Kapabacteria bacterium]|nr:FAD-binding protein [Candidatus Kapabacteria bacterium]